MSNFHISELLVSRAFCRSAIRARGPLFLGVVLSFFSGSDVVQVGCCRRRRRTTSRANFSIRVGHESEHKTVKRRGICCSFCRSGFVALSVRFADFYCCCLSYPRPTGRVRCGHYRIGAIETLVQTENKDLSVSAPHQSIENCLLYPLVCESSPCDAPFCRTFCFRLCM